MGRTLRLGIRAIANNTRKITIIRLPILPPPPSMAIHYSSSVGGTSVVPVPKIAG